MPSSKSGVFKRRLTSSIILWTLVISALFSGNKLLSDYVFLVVMMTIAGFGLSEFYALIGQRGLVCFKGWGIFGGLLLMASTFLYLSGVLASEVAPAEANDFETSFFILFVLGLCLRQFVSRSNTAGLLAISTTLFGLMYVPWLLNFIQKINFYPGVEGAYYVLYFILVTKFSDLGAYVTGSLIGRHKMIPRISPNKTWEGTVASFAAALLIGLLSARFLWEGNGYWHLVLLAAVLNVAGQLGDLAESALKRNARVKDSSHLVPGHGGVLDRLDALLFAAPVLWYYWLGKGS